MLQFAPQTSELALEAGASSSACIKVRSPRLRWRRPKPAHRFSVRVSAPGAASTERPASFTQVPLLPRWAPLAATVVAVALIGGIFVLGHKTTNVPIQHAGASSQVTERSGAAPATTATRPTAAAPVTPRSSAPTAAPTARPSGPETGCGPAWRQCRLDHND